VLFPIHSNGKNGVFVAAVAGLWEAGSGAGVTDPGYSGPGSQTPATAAPKTGSPL
jgi:hypothetical protein